MKPSQGAEAHHGPVERDRHRAMPVGVERALHQRVRDASCSLLPVLGKGRFQDGFGRIARHGISTRSAIASA